MPLYISPLFLSNSLLSPIHPRGCPSREQNIVALQTFRTKVPGCVNVCAREKINDGGNSEICVRRKSGNYQKIEASITVAACEKSAARKPDALKTFDECWCTRNYARLCECSVRRRKAGFRRGRHSNRSAGWGKPGREVDPAILTAHAVLSRSHMRSSLYCRVSRQRISTQRQWISFSSPFLPPPLLPRRHRRSFIFRLLFRSSFDTCRWPNLAEARYWWCDLFQKYGSCALFNN